MPTVSVNMPVFNREKFVAEAIESILGQTYSDFEFIIVDDGSQDRSAEIIGAYAERDSRIRLIQLEENGGTADARNHALAASSGEYIAVMDSDDVSLPERLRKQVEYLRSHPEVGVLGTGMTAVRADLTPFYRYPLASGHVAIVLAFFLGYPIVQGTMMLRRDLLLAAGCYEPSRRTAEEIGIWSRLMWRTRFANLPEPLLLYRWHDSQNHLNPSQEYREQAYAARERLLESFWGEAPKDTMERFVRVRQRQRIGWAERRLARRDIKRLIDSMIESGLLEAKDRTTLNAEMNMHLERTSPRLWQMFCHWRRHHFGRQ